MARVLVTGATGFIASHLVLALIERGFDVRGTARSAASAGPLNKTLSAYSGRDIDIEIVPADLTRDEGWAEAMAGVDYVHHVASPFPAHQPKHPDELIVPARDGALRALKAAKAAGVKRVVLTSSFAAVGYGWGDKRPGTLTEEHWSDPDNLEDNTAYARSKTIAELAAWDYVKGEGQGLELAVVNPVAVLGPAMSADVSTSLQLVTQIMRKQMPAYPRLTFGVVDVRDVADMHVRAMEVPEAAGERFLCGEDTFWFSEIGAMLREAYPDRNLPKSELPNWMVKGFALFRPELKMILPELGRRRDFSNEKARRVLGWNPRPSKEAILSSADSLIKLGEI